MAFFGLFSHFLTVLANAAATGIPFVENAAVVVLGVLEIIKVQIDFHNGAIDAAKINDDMENGNLILEQTCTMFNFMETKSNEVNRKLDELLCPFGPGAGGAAFTALCQGCVAINQDCNSAVDQCIKDKMPPSLTLQTPIPDKSFKSTNEACQLLQQKVIVYSDCATEFQTEIQLQNRPDYCDCEFQVRTADVH